METLQVTTESKQTLLLVLREDHAKIIVGGAWLQSALPIKDGRSIMLTPKKVKDLIPRDSDDIVVEVRGVRWHLIGNKFFRRVK